jgi:hypothetical protein
MLSYRQMRLKQKKKTLKTNLNDEKMIDGGIQFIFFLKFAISDV